MELFLLSTCTLQGVTLDRRILEHLGFRAGQIMDAELLSPAETADHLELRCASYSLSDHAGDDFLVSAYLHNRIGAADAFIALLHSLQPPLSVFAIDSAAVPARILCAVRAPGYTRDSLMSALEQATRERALTHADPPSRYIIGDIEVRHTSGSASHSRASARYPMVLRVVETYFSLDLGRDLVGEIEKRLATLQAPHRLSECHAIVSVDPVEYLLRIVILPPTEIIVHLDIEATLPVDDLSRAASWLADRNVDLRIVKGFVPTRRLPRTNWHPALGHEFRPLGLGNASRLVLLTDVSRSYLRTMSQRTLACHVAAGLQSWLCTDSSHGALRPALEVEATFLNPNPSRDAAVDVRNVFLLEVSPQDDQLVMVIEAKHSDGGRYTMALMFENLRVPCAPTHFADVLEHLAQLPGGREVYDLDQRRRVVLVAKRDDPSMVNDERIRPLVYCADVVGADRPVRATFFCMGARALCIVLGGENRLAPSVEMEIVERLTKDKGRSATIGTDQVGRISQLVYRELGPRIRTAKEVAMAGTEGRDRFREEARRRFSQLGAQGYIQEKASIDRFPVEMNHQLGCWFARRLTGRRKLKVIDVGCGPGSLSTVLVVYHLLGVTGNVELRRVDILDHKHVQPADASTYAGLWRLEWPKCVEERLERAVALVAQSRYDGRGFEEWMAEGNAEWDIALSAFTGHHLNDESRRDMIRAMFERVAPGGLLGIVDECPTYDEYVEWVLQHMRTGVEPALEAFWSHERWREELKILDDELLLEYIPKEMSFVALLHRRLQAPAVVRGSGFVRVRKRTLAVVVDAHHSKQRKQTSPGFAECMKEVLGQWQRVLAKHGCRERKEYAFAGDRLTVFTQAVADPGRCVEELIKIVLMTESSVFVRGGVRMAAEGEVADVADVGKRQSVVLDWAGHAEKSLEELSDKIAARQGVLLAFHPDEWTAFGEGVYRSVLAQAPAHSFEVVRKQVELNEAGHAMLLQVTWRQKSDLMLEDDESGRQREA